MIPAKEEIHNRRKMEDALKNGIERVCSPEIEKSLLPNYYWLTVESVYHLTYLWVGNNR